MPHVIKLKRNATAGEVPDTSILADGEACLNSGDGLMYVRMGANVHAFAPMNAQKAETGNFTAEYDVRHEVDVTANVDITLPSWDLGRTFQVLIDGSTASYVVKFLYDSANPMNGSSTDLSVLSKSLGDIITVIATGTDSDKSWSITQQKVI